MALTKCRSVPLRNLLLSVSNASGTGGKACWGEYWETLEEDFNELILFTVLTKGCTPATPQPS